MLRCLPVVTLAVLAAASLAIACGTDTEAGDSSNDALTHASSVQMNDVSILFPLAKTKTELDSGYLLAKSAGRRGALVPLDLVKDNGFVWPDDHQPVLAGGQLNKLRYPFVRVVSMRLDPCAAHIGAITDASTCQAQMRLVLEDVTMDDEAHSASANDAALHAGYALTATEFKAAVAEIVALREANAPNRDLGPLAPHPVMVEQGLGGAMAKGVNKIILKYAGKSNLARVTRLSLNGYDSPFHPRDWVFAGINVKNGEPQPISISALPTDSFGETLTPTPKAMHGGPVFPAFEPGPNVDDITNMRELEFARAASEADRQKAFDSTLRIDNPNVHSFDTIDCASCHASEAFRTLIGEKGLRMTSNADRFDPAAIVGAESAKNTAPPKDMTNFHAFSYSGTEAGISQRVLNETASVVGYLNRQ